MKARLEMSPDFFVSGVVNEDVEPFTLAGGTPAKLIKRIDVNGA